MFGRKKKSRAKVATIGEVVTEKDLPFMNMQNHVKLAWKSSYLAYYEPAHMSQSLLFANAEEIRVCATKLDYAFFVKYNDGSYTFNYRGTDTEDKNFKQNVETWFSNLDAFPLRTPKDKEDAINMAREAGILKNGIWGKGTIHDGFYTVWENFKPWVRGIIKEFKIKAGDVVLTDGHSRGGPFAELCSRDMAKNLGIPNRCVTFGAPGCGTEAYREEFRMLPIHGIRVVDGWDLVADAAIGFDHGCAKKIWYPKPKIFKWILPARIRDHWQSRYDKKTMG